MSGSIPEMETLSTDYWLTRWEEATPERRAQMAQQVVANAVTAASCLARDHANMEQEVKWLAQALQQQEAAYAALEAQYLAVSDAHAHLVDRVSALAAEAIR